ncbi:MAG: methyltransferase domain-containing protein [Candidatus Odyssella sp.]|nr:methyltransferase domain-containing protein [Candidatus Odyssella sp.]
MDKVQPGRQEKPRTSHGGPADVLRFLRSFVTAPMRTGAQWPSGKALSRAMAAPVDLAVPGPIVELGPGTGVVTEALLARGVPPERLTMIEFSPQFAKLLSQRYPNVRLVQGDAYALAEHVRKLGLAPPAAVVSSLPLLTQPPAKRLELLRTALRIMNPEGVFVQFTYFRDSPIPVEGTGIDTSVSPRIWMNIWPALVYSYRRGPARKLRAHERDAAD